MSQAFVVIDLGYGDSGKGTIVDWLTREYDAETIIRYNGGGQAAHHVVLPDGQFHRFQQFGSGTLAGANVRTFLSRHMLVNPTTILDEARMLTALGVDDPLSRVLVDEAALITTPYHMVSNRLHEIARGDARHGSCGMGIGETRRYAIDFPEDALRAGDLLNLAESYRKLGLMRTRMLEAHASIDVSTNMTAYTLLCFLENLDTIEMIQDDFREFAIRADVINHRGYRRVRRGNIILEGAQGVLLDEAHGFYPYNSWTDTTLGNAQKILTEIAWDGEVTTLGVLRAYMTRHGAGPFVTEDPVLGEKIPESHNHTNPWQQGFRFGHFDRVAIKYAIDVAGGKIDGLAVTCLDHLSLIPDGLRICIGYTCPTRDEELFEYSSDGMIEAIRVNESGDLDRQARLTELLFQCQPVYMEIGDPRMMVGILEGMFQIPVMIMSGGPTHEDKKMFRQFA